MLIGNKKDLVDSGEFKRPIDDQLVKDFCSRFDLKYYETSAKTGENIKKSFEDLVNIIYDKGDSNPGNQKLDRGAITLSSHLHNPNNRAKSRDKGCC